MWHCRRIHMAPSLSQLPSAAEPWREGSGKVGREREERDPVQHRELRFLQKVQTSNPFARVHTYTPPLPKQPCHKAIRPRPNPAAVAELLQPNPED